MMFLYHDVDVRVVTRKPSMLVEPKGPIMEEPACDMCLSCKRKVTS
jgi:hypothetical protein